MKQLQPKREEDGSYTLNFNFIPPDAEIFAFSASEIGVFALAAFANPDKWVGKDIRVVAEWLTVRRMAKEASEETGLDVRCFEGTIKDLENSKVGPVERDLYLMSMYYMQVNPSTLQDADSSSIHNRAVFVIDRRP